MARPRNNLAKLPADVRLRVCELLDDGAEYAAIRRDPDIAAACAENALTLHNTTFLAYRESDEFQEYCDRRREWSGSMRRNKIAAMVVESGDGSDSIARLADYKLLQICLDKLEDGEDLEGKELASISRAVASYNRNRIAEDKEDAKRAAADKEALYQAEIAKLSAQISALTERLNNGNQVDPAAVQDNLNRILGVKK